MLRTCAVLAVLIVPAGRAFGAAPSASPDPKSLVVPDQVLSKARDLVQQLGSEEFAEREVAEKTLEQMGRVARAALLEGANADPSPEVRTRCQTLLPRATTLEMKARIEVFLADAEGRFEHDLPGWHELRSLVRNEWAVLGHPVWSDRSLDKAARAVFAEFIAGPANRHVMMAVGGNGDLAAVASARRQELYAQRNPRPVIVGGRVTYPNRKDITLADVATLLLAEALTGGKSSAPRNSSMSILISSSGFTAAVQGDTDAARVYRAVAAAWFDTRTDVMDMYYATTIAGNLGMTDHGCRVAVRLLESKGAAVAYRGMAAANLARLGNKTHVPLLEKLMADNAVLTTVRKNVPGKPVNEWPTFEIQLRDVALAVSLILSGQKPEDYGFVDQFKANGNAGVGVAYSYTRLYLPEGDRKAAFDKWKEWRAKNP